MMVWNEVCEQELPESLRDILEAIGFEATLRLVARFGGTRIYVSSPDKMAHPEHPVAVVIGHEAALALARLCGGMVVKIPKAERAVRCARNRRILKLSEAGWTAGAIAREVGLSEETVYRILGNPDGVTAPRPRAARQLSLVFE